MVKYREPRYHSSDLVVFVLTAAGWLLAWQELMPFGVNVIVASAAIVLAGKVLWRWEETRKWKLRQRQIVWALSWVIFAGTFAPGLRSQYKREYNIHLEFKESPEFDWWYEFLMRRACAGMQDYFRKLRIPVPPETPPVGVKHGPAESMKYEISLPPNLPLYRSMIAIDERDAREGNIREFTNEYAFYVIFTDMKLPEESVALKGQPPNDLKRLELTQRFDAVNAFETYFNWAYWDADLGRAHSPWTDYLWHMRRELGDDYADKLAAVTLNTLADTPMEGMDANVDVYFCRHLRTAFDVIDNGARHWADIEQALGSSRVSQSCPAK